VRAANPSLTIVTSTRRERPAYLLWKNECFIALNMVEQLAELGYSVVGPAFTIAEARHLAAVASIDAAVVDLNLRGVFAEEVADILVFRKIPFLFVTGYSEVPDRRFREIPILAKPFQILDLHRAVDDMLARTLQFAAVDATQSQP
jgi:two-component SAPR family response regulator